uniref:Ephrin-A4 n=1 Tax=Geospiza parvula TaxID=87175 RepID=A0A8U8CJZ0_GEOPR
MRPAPLLGLLLWAPLLWAPPVRGFRHGVHWNGSNPRFLRDDYSIQVAINDYLDIYCPHYERAVPAGRAETFTLFMVDREGYRGCYETPGAFKRWECNRPRAPFGPVRFSEKIQRFTPFSLGFEFQPGETYYYISVPSPESAGRCLKLRVTVCCRGTSESGWGGCAPKLGGSTCPHWGTPEPPRNPREPLADHRGVLFSARAGDRGAEFAAPRARGPRRCGSCPGHRGPVAALHPMPGARAPGPALDLTPALPLPGGWAPLPHRRFQTLPPSQTPEPVGQPQAMTRLLDLRKAELGPGAPGWKVRGSGGFWGAG